MRAAIGATGMPMADTGAVMDILILAVVIAVVVVGALGGLIVGSRRKKQLPPPPPAAPDITAPRPSRTSATRPRRRGRNRGAP